MADEKWTVEHFQKELLTAEKSGRFAYDELTPLWEKAKEAIENEQDAVSLYTTYIYLTRRFIAKQGSDDYTQMDDLFHEALEFLAECFEDFSDATIQMQKNYAYFLYTKMKKPENAREIWDELLNFETGPFAWLEAILLERAYGDVQHARRLFYKSLDAVTFRPHDIFAAFVQFEREEGTREDLDRALERINAKVAESADDNQQQRKKQQQPNVKRTQQKRNVERQKQNQHNQKETKTPASTKYPSNNKPSATPKGLKENADEEMETEHQQSAGTFQTSSIPLGPMIPGMSVQEGNNPEEMNIPKSDSLPPKMNLKTEPKNIEEGVEERTGQKRKREMNLHEQQAFPYGTGLEKNKLFVKHLHFGCKEMELTQFFKRYGNVLDVRIVTKWNGQSKGCAYIDFATDEEAAAAVEGANGAVLHGRKIAVYLSNPPPKRPKLDEDNSIGNADHGKGDDKVNERDNQQTSSKSAESRKETTTTSKLQFAPRVMATIGQRPGKGGRLMLQKSISKLTADTTDVQQPQCTNSPVGSVTQSTGEMNLTSQKQVNIR